MQPADLPSHLRDSLAFAEALAERHQAQQTTTVSWLNHFSVQNADRDALREFDFVGVDGKFLQVLTSSHSRTSADMVLPYLVPLLQDARIVVIGGFPESNPGPAVDVLCQGLTKVVGHIDGYEGLSRGRLLADALEEVQASVVLVGLGAELQDAVAAEAAEAATVRLAITCGGFLDQIQVPNYYPAWAYPLRLNWLVRVAREPRRLWRRYTIDAAAALRQRSELRAFTRSLRGWSAAQQLARNRRP